MPIFPTKQKKVLGITDDERDVTSEYDGNGDYRDCVIFNLFFGGKELTIKRNTRA